MQRQIDQITAAVKAYDVTRAEFSSELLGPHERVTGVTVFEESIVIARGNFFGWAAVAFEGGDEPEPLTFFGYFGLEGAFIHAAGFELDGDHPIWDKLLATPPVKVTTVAQR